MLKGNTICIRSVRESDLDTLLSLINDIENQGPFLPGTMQSEGNFKRRYAETGFLEDSDQRYVIVDAKDHIVGGIWAFKSVPYFDALEVGYQIFKPDNRGKGYASEALQLFHHYLFSTARINRVELRIATTNVASQKVALKLGFQHEGTHREAAYSQGILHDINTYAMLRRDWAARRSTT